MRKINKTHPPAALVTYAQQIGASFEEMDANVKDAVKKSLLNEQGWVCGYCQQVITSETRMKIEHFCEQSICDGTDGMPDRRLDYTNIMAVCLGKASSQILHCDTQKATFNVQTGLPIEISPWIDAHMAAIQYHRSGRVSSSNLRHDREINIILNLNIPLLKELRRKKMTEIYRLCRHKNPAMMKQKMIRLLEQDLASVGNGFVNNFPGLSEYMLRKYI